MTLTSSRQQILKRALIPGAGTILLASATGGMSGDIFNLYVTQTLGHGTTILVWVYLGMLLSIPIQLTAPRLANRFGYRRVMAAGALLCVPALLLLSVTEPVGEVTSHSQRALHSTAIILAAILVEFSFSVSFGSVWTAWIAQFSSRADRPVMLAALSVASQGVMAAAFLCQTVFFSGNVSTTFYRSLMLILIAYLGIASLIFFTLPEGEMLSGEGPRTAMRWRLWWRRPAHRFIAVSEALQFLVGVPLLSVYLVLVLDYPPHVVSIALVARTVASLSLTLFLGRLIRNRSSERIITSAALYLSGVLVIWLLLPRYDGGPVLLGAVVVLVPALQLGKAALAICISDIQYELVPAEERTETFTMIDLVSSSAMQVSAILAAYAVAAANHGGLIDSGWLHIDVVKIWVGIGSVVALYLSYTYRSYVLHSGEPERTL